MLVDIHGASVADARIRTEGIDLAEPVECLGEGPRQLVVVGDVALGEGEGLSHVFREGMTPRIRDVESNHCPSIVEKVPAEDGPDP